MATPLATKFEAHYKVGVSDRKAGKPIKLREAFVAEYSAWEKDHSLILDLYFCYAKGYRATAPTPLVMANSNDWKGGF